MEIMKSDLEDRVSEEDRNVKNSSSRNLSYSHQLSKGLVGLKAHSLVKEIKNAAEKDKKKEIKIAVEEDKKKESNNTRSRDS